MRSSFAAILQGFTLPFGRTSGRRLVFDGPNGEIRIYDSSDRLRLQIGSALPSTILFFTGNADEIASGAIAALAHIVSGETYESLRLTSPANSLDAGASPEAAVVELRSRSEDGSEAPMVALKPADSTEDFLLGIADDSSGTRNQPMGTAVLVAGTVTVTHSEVHATSRIFLTHLVAGGTLGILSVGTITAGTSFVINSSNAADTSTVCYLIAEPL